MADQVLGIALLRNYVRSAQGRADIRGSIDTPQGALFAFDDVGITTASTTYVPTAATITCPTTGTYLIELSAHAGIAATETAWVSVLYDGVAAVDADGDFLYSSASNVDARIGRRILRTVYAGTTVQVQVRMATAVARAFTKIELSITPVRVG